MTLRNLMIQSNGIEIGLFRSLVVSSLRTESGERSWQRIVNQSESSWSSGSVAKDRNLSCPVRDGGIGCGQRGWCTPHIRFLLWREQESSGAEWIGNACKPIVVPANLREVNRVPQVGFKGKEDKWLVLSDGAT